MKVPWRKDYGKYDQQSNFIQNFTQNGHIPKCPLCSEQSRMTTDISSQPVRHLHDRVIFCWIPAMPKKKRNFFSCDIKECCKRCQVTKTSLIDGLISK